MCCIRKTISMAIDIALNHMTRDDSGEYFEYFVKNKETSIYVRDSERRMMMVGGCTVYAWPC